MAFLGEACPTLVCSNFYVCISLSFDHLRARLNPIVHPHPHRHASSSSTPSLTQTHAACNDLRVSRLSAQAAASQPTAWHQLPMSSAAGICA
jgi:hypothetical protein